MTLAIAAAVALTVALGIYSMWVVPVRGWRRTAGPAAFAALLVGQAVAYVGAMGVSRPAAWWLGGSIHNATLVSYVFDEPRNIFVWVQEADGEPPLALRFAWDRKLAEAIFELMKSDGASLDMAMAFGVSASPFVAVHPRPPERNPVKHGG